MAMRGSGEDVLLFIRLGLWLTIKDRENCFSVRGDTEWWEVMEEGIVIKVGIFLLKPGIGFLKPECRWIKNRKFPVKKCEAGYSSFSNS
jgi:hypothetical protein